jgi:GDP-mannose 6-dehydrogenase
VKIAVFGLGYVGAVTAACLAERGHAVTGIDPHVGKVELINAGRSPIVEAGIEPLIRAGVDAGRLRATTDPSAAADCDVALLCVGTPSRRNGQVELALIAQATADLGRVIRDSPRMLVVFRSSMPPGSVDRCLVPLLQDASGRQVGEELHVAYCPEFLREGSGVADFYDPPFLVIGTDDDWVATRLSELFDFVSVRPTLLSIASAEMLKYACNAFHAVKVVFANEIGVVAAALGADARAVMRTFCQDTSLNIAPAYLRPGFAYGGSCLPKDLRALVHEARMADVDLPLLSTVAVSNEHHVRRAIDAVVATGEREVALLGLSFKHGTDDLRESPYVDLAEVLLGKGAHLRIYDAQVNPDRLTGSNGAAVDEHLPHLRRILHRRPEDALEGAGVAVVAAAEDDIVAALLANPPMTILDLCGFLGPDVERLPGYSGIAW